MSEALIPADLIASVGTKELSKDFNRGSEYLPSLRIFDGSSGKAKEGLVKPGEIAITTSDELIELGREVTVLVCGQRPRASIFQGGEPPINYFDPESQDFQEVKALAMAKTQNYQAGYEYLVWVPAANQFAVLFLGNASGRRVSGAVEALLGRGAHLESKFVKKGKNSWYAFSVEESTTPFDLPEKEELVKATKLFIAPLKKEEEGRER